MAECSSSPDFAYLSRAHLPTCPLHFSPTGLRVPPHKGPCFRVHCPAGLACVPSSQPLMPPGGCLVTTSFFPQKSHSSGKPFLMPKPEPRPDGAQSPITCLLRVYREGLRNPWTHQAGDRACFPPSMSPRWSKDRHSVTEMWKLRERRQMRRVKGRRSRG